MLAPIILFVYNRPKNTKEVLESLSHCILAEASSIFIFSDAPKNDEAISLVNEVRCIIDNDKWKKKFKEVTIYKNSNNKGLATSVITGVTKIFNNNEKVIVIEDDNRVSIDFLDYMNRGLDFYEDDLSIGMIGGYTVPIKFPKDYKYDVYKMGRGSSYAWATWKNRWDKVDWEVSDYNIFKKSRRMKRAFNYYGNDRVYMLNNQMNGKIDSWAIRFAYFMFKNNMYAILPVHTKVENIGFDGRGVHNVAGETRFINKIPNQIKKVNFANVELDERIRRKYVQKFKEKLNVRIKRIIKIG